MEFSQIFLEILKILNESVKILSKNGKVMGLVTILSLLLPSILFSLFRYSHQFLVDCMAKSLMHHSSLLILQMLIRTALLFPLNMVAFFLSCSVIFQFSAVATIFVSAASYTDEDKLSLQNLVSRMKATWRKQLMDSFSRSREPTRLQLALGAASDVAVCLMAVVFSPSFIFMASASSVWPLSSVVSVVEKCSDGGEAAERAERLVEGHRVHGFMQSSLYCVSILVCCLILVFGDAGPMIGLKRGLLLLNSLSLGRILWCVLHTVLYFQCKEVENPRDSEESFPRSN